MTKTTSDAGSAAQSSQDCSICLNSIAVGQSPSEPAAALCRRLTSDSHPQALPMPVCGPLLPHVALQVYPLSAFVSAISHFHLSELSGCRRPGGRGGGPRGMGTARVRGRPRRRCPGGLTSRDANPTPARRPRGTHRPATTRYASRTRPGSDGRDHTGGPFGPTTDPAGIDRPADIARNRRADAYSGRARCRGTPGGHGPDRAGAKERADCEDTVTHRGERRGTRSRGAHNAPKRCRAMGIRWERHQDARHREDQHRQQRWGAEGQSVGGGVLPSGLRTKAGTSGSASSPGV